MAPSAVAGHVEVAARRVGQLPLVVGAGPRPMEAQRVERQQAVEVRGGRQAAEGDHHRRRHAGGAPAVALDLGVGPADIQGRQRVGRPGEPGAVHTPANPPDRHRQRRRRRRRPRWPAASASSRPLRPGPSSSGVPAGTESRQTFERRCWCRHRRRRQLAQGPVAAALAAGANAAAKTSPARAVEPHPAGGRRRIRLEVPPRRGRQRRDADRRPVDRQREALDGGQADPQPGEGARPRGDGEQIERARCQARVGEQIRRGRAADARRD